MNTINEETLNILSNNYETNYNRLLAAIGIGSNDGLLLVK